MRRIGLSVDSHGVYRLEGSALGDVNAQVLQGGSRGQARPGEDSHPQACRRIPQRLAWAVSVVWRSECSLRASGCAGHHMDRRAVSELMLAGCPGVQILLPVLRPAHDAFSKPAPVNQAWQRWVEQKAVGSCHPDDQGLCKVGAFDVRVIRDPWFMPDSAHADDQLAGIAEQPVYLVH